MGPVRATLLLADAGQADSQGKVHALGLGWSITSTPTPPIAVAILIECPWDETNTKHQMLIELVDADGYPVSFRDDSLGNPEPAVRIEGEFEVGRPAGALAGSPLRQPFVVNVGPGLPLVAGQKYEFRLRIDGEPMDSTLGAFMVNAAS